jgi:hypothetical protein
MARGERWSPDEVAATVADYFDMFEVDLKGGRVNKAHHRRRLRAVLRGRTSAAIEMKHENISAVLRDAGFPFIGGYAPLGNYQHALVDEVRHQLESRPALVSLMERVSSSYPERTDITWEDVESLRVPPPAAVVREGRAGPRPFEFHAGQFVDYVARDAANRRLGELGERFVLEWERARLRARGRESLADRVSWVSKEQGDGLGYDVGSFLPSGRPIMIEVKTTNHDRRFPFTISRHEVATSVRFDEQYRLYRLFEFSTRPRLFVLEGVVTRACRLEPHVFRGYPA